MMGLKVCEINGRIRDLYDETDPDGRPERKMKIEALERLRREKYREI